MKTASVCTSEGTLMGNHRAKMNICGP